MLIGLIKTTVMITSFVAAMMLIIEYVNVQTRGIALRALAGSPFRQYWVAALLGAVPGCLGAFVVVALFTHRKLSLGALVAAMIATSGDESFVMLALFPITTVLMSVGLVFLGILAGWLTDKLMPAHWQPAVDSDCVGLEVHEEETIHLFSFRTVVAQWRAMTLYRAVMMFALVLAISAVALGYVGPGDWGWKRITILLVMSSALLIVSTVSNHFLEKHLWVHVAKHHAPRIFLWTGGVIASIACLMYFVDLKAVVADNPWSTLVIASVVGLLPESGPHLLFVTMYADKIAPLAVLVAGSIVQDGHGMLPLLSTSRKAFIVVKLINFVVGLAVGGIMLAIQSSP